MPDFSTPEDIPDFLSYADVAAAKGAGTLFIRKNV